jgi:hypothetical protein
MKKIKKLLDVYAYPGFHPQAAIKGIFGDNRSRIITLVRVQKKLSAGAAVLLIKASMTARSGASGIYPAVISGFIWKWRFGESNV